MQGRGACVHSKFFACVNRKASRGKTDVRESNASSARLGENSAERKQDFSDLLMSWLKPRLGGQARPTKNFDQRQKPQV